MSKPTQESKPTPVPTVFSLLLNVCSLLICSRGLYKCTQLILPSQLIEAGHKQFLTNISVGVTLMSNVMNIINWFVQRSKCATKNDKRCNAKCISFVSRHLILPIALILESIVPLVYWPLRLFAQNLIMQDVPRDAPNPLPLSTDVSIHLFPFVFLFADHYLSGYGQKFAISNSKAWLIVTALGMSYYKYLAILIDTTTGQMYPYPFLDVDEPYKSIIFVIVSTIAWLFYILYQRFPPCSEKIPKKKTN